MTLSSDADHKRKPDKGDQTLPEREESSLAFSSQDEDEAPTERVDPSARKRIQSTQEKLGASPTPWLRSSIPSRPANVARPGVPVPNDEGLRDKKESATPAVLVSQTKAAIENKPTQVMPSIPVTPLLEVDIAVENKPTQAVPSMPVTPAGRGEATLEPKSGQTKAASGGRKKTVPLENKPTQTMPATSGGRKKTGTLEARTGHTMPTMPSTPQIMYMTSMDQALTQTLPLVALSTSMAADLNEKRERITGYMAAVQGSAFGIENFAIEEQTTWMLPSVRIAQKGQLAERKTTGTQRQTVQTAKKEESTGYNSTLTKLLKSSGIYALASFVSPLIALILAPFLTKNLAPAEYGALAVCTTAIALLISLTQLGLNHAFFRAYSLDYEETRDRKRVVSTLVALLLLITIPVTIGIAWASPWISIFLLGDTSFSDAVKIMALVVLLQNATVPGFSWLRAEGKAAFFSVLSILNLLISLTGNLVLVGVFHLGIRGALASTASGYAMVALCTLPYILIRVGIRLRMDIVRNMLSFGIPLVTSVIAVWVLQLADRYMLSHLGSLTQTGSYAVAYTLGNVMGAVVLSPFSLAWPTAMFTVAKRDDAPQVFRLIFRWYSLALLLVTFVFSLVSTCILFLFFPPSYFTASPVIPIVAVSIMFYGIHDMFSIGVGIKRKTWYGVVYVSFAALLNVICNFFLIPQFGSIGAALATLIAYVVLMVTTYIVNQRIYPIPFEIGKFALGLCTGVAFYLGASLFVLHQSIYLQVTVYLIALIAYAIVLVLLGNPFPFIKKLLNKRRGVVSNG